MKPLLATIPALLALPASAIVIRDDRADAQYQSLAAQFESVGRLINGAPEGATGVLIAPTWVLTAGHCGVLIGPSSTFVIGGNTYAIAHTIVHPEWLANPHPGFAGDLALVRLAAPVTNVAAASRLGGGGEVGLACVSVGFGKSGVGSAGASTPAGIKRACQNRIDAAGAMGLPLTTLLYDFDNPANPAHSTLGSALPAELEGGPAAGDDGGGAFAQFFGGPWRLIGIHSFAFDPAGAIGNGGYGSIAAITRITSYNTWIDRTMCFANCDGSATPPILNVDDFICFQSRFAAADLATADCDHNGALNVIDFTCFQTAFAAGCP